MYHSNRNRLICSRILYTAEVETTLKDNKTQTKGLGEMFCEAKQEEINRIKVNEKSFSNIRFAEMNNITMI